MPSSPEFPEVPVDEDDGWELVEESVDTVFSMPAMTVLGATRQYDDRRTREAVRAATDGEIDHQWRFLSATRLGFSPRLPPGTMPSALLPTIRRQARNSFTDRLSERDVSEIGRRGRQRMRVASGSRAYLTRYGGTTVVAGSEIPVTGWVGTWYDRPDFFIVTGGYPAVHLGDALSLDSNPDLLESPTAARDELLDVFREVS
jgi:hypothetical protein